MGGADGRAEDQAGSDCEGGVKKGFAFLAEVFDGGVGDCPHLLEACQEWTRQWNLEERRRRIEPLPAWNSEAFHAAWANRRDCIDGFLMERIRVEAAYFD